MITKEQKQLIEEVKRESGTNEFLSVSDLIVRIEQNYKEKSEDIYYEDVGITFSEWNDFLRNTPLSMDLFIGEDAIFEGFEKKDSPIHQPVLWRLHGKDNLSRITLFPSTQWEGRQQWEVKTLLHNERERDFCIFTNSNLYSLITFLSLRELKGFIFLK